MTIATFSSAAIAARASSASCTISRWAVTIGANRKPGSSLLLFSQSSALSTTVSAFSRSLPKPGKTRTTVYSTSGGLSMIAPSDAVRIVPSGTLLILGRTGTEDDAFRRCASRRGIGYNPGQLCEDRPLSSLWG